MQVIASYDRPQNAHLARIRLEAEGIRAVVLDEHSTVNTPRVFRYMESIKVAVPTEEAQRAAAILYPTAAGRVRRCPACESDNVQRDGLPEYLALILYAFTLGLLKPRRRCADCRHTWRE